MYIKHYMLFFKRISVQRVYTLICFSVDIVCLIYRSCLYWNNISGLNIRGGFISGHVQMFTMLGNIAWQFLYCICSTIILNSYGFFFILSFVMFNPICWIPYVLEEMIRGGDWINIDEVHINLWQQVLCHSAHELVSFCGRDCKCVYECISV